MSAFFQLPNVSAWSDRQCDFVIAVGTNIAIGVADQKNF